MTAPTTNDSTKAQVGKKLATCSKCSGDRNCYIMGSYVDSGTEDYGENSLHWYNTWSILKCCGCDHTFVQVIRTDSEDVDYSYDHEGKTVLKWAETKSYWPAQAKRAEPTWMPTIFDENFELYRALKELYGALENDLNTLAGIGIRTCFEMTSDMLGVEESLSFTDKLNELVAQKHIDSGDHALLEKIIDAGNASAHRGWYPTAPELLAMMEVLEHFIDKVVIHPKLASKRQSALAQLTVPPKKKRIKAQKLPTAAPTTVPPI